MIDQRAVTSHTRPTPTASPELTYAGYGIVAPGFDAKTFAAAIDRALADGLSMTPGRAAGTWLVTNVAKGTRREYVVHPRHGCSCRATGPCKHRALVVLIEAIVGTSEVARGP